MKEKNYNLKQLKNILGHYKLPDQIRCTGAMNTVPPKYIPSHHTGVQLGSNLANVKDMAYNIDQTIQQAILPCDRRRSYDVTDHGRQIGNV